MYLAYVENRLYLMEKKIKMVIGVIFLIFILYPRSVHADGFREICRAEKPIGRLWERIGTGRQDEATIIFSFQTDGNENRVILTYPSTSGAMGERESYIVLRDGRFQSPGNQNVNWFVSNQRWLVTYSRSTPDIVYVELTLHFVIAEEDVDSFFHPATCGDDFYLKTLNEGGSGMWLHGSRAYRNINIQIQRTRPRPDENAETAGNQVLYQILYGEAGEITTNQPQDCDSILGDPNEPEDLAWLLGRILAYFRIFGPSLVIVLSSIDFAKAVINSDEEASVKARKKLLIRTLLAMSLFLLPDLVSLIFGIAGLTHDNATCGL